MKKRALSWVLACCMALNFMGVQAFATQSQIEPPASVTEENQAATEAPSATAAPQQVCTCSPALEQGAAGHAEGCPFYIAPTQAPVQAPVQFPASEAPATAAPEATAAPQPTAPASEATAVCVCTAACAQDAPNAACPVCSAAAADLTACAGATANVASVMAAGVPVEDPGYTYDETTGTLTVTTNAGTTAWKSDKTISAMAVRFVVIAEGVTKIGRRAFYQMGSVVSLTIPSTVVEIEDNAFSYSAELDTIMCNAMVPPKLVGDPFYNVGSGNNCANFKIYVPKTDPHYLQAPGWSQYGNRFIVVGKPQYEFHADTGLLIVKDDQATNAWRGDPSILPSSIKEVWVESGVKAIRSNAFSQCSALEKISIANTVVEIGSLVFEGCESLTKVHLPNSVTTLDVAVFSGCKSLKDLKLSEALTEIPFNMMPFCDSLESITIPKNVTKIGFSAFGGCSALSSVVCEPLKAPTLGNSSAFPGNEGMKIYVPEGDEAYKTGENWKRLNEDDEISMVFGGPYLSAISTIAGTIVEPFAPTTQRYLFTENLSPNSSVSIKPTALQSDTAVITVNGEVVASGTNSQAIPVDGDGNWKATIVVTCGSESMTYILKTPGLVKKVTVTPDAKTKIYGDADPALTYTVTPALAEGDTLLGGLSCEHPEKAGTYEITSTLHHDDYDITYVPGNLEIQKAKLIARFENIEATEYSLMSRAMTYCTGLKNGDSERDFYWLLMPEYMSMDGFSTSCNYNPGVHEFTARRIPVLDNYVVEVIPGKITVLERYRTKPPTEAPVITKTEPSIGVPEESLPDGVAREDLSLGIAEATADDKEALNDAIKDAASFKGIPAEQVEMREMSLLDTKNKSLVEPNGEVTIFYPYPEGTDKDSDFSVIHHLGTTSTPAKAASSEESVSFEELQPELLDEGILITVDSLSPFAFGWKKAAAPTSTPAPTAAPTTNPTATPNPTGTATPTATPNPTGTAAPTATPNPTGTAAPTATPNPTATAAPTAAPNPTATATPTAVPNPTAAPSAGGDAQTDPAHEFWYAASNLVLNANKGDVIKVNAGQFHHMPAAVMENLRLRGVGMVIAWTGGDAITIPAGKALNAETGRLTWSLSELSKKYGSYTLVNTDTGTSTGTKKNPSTNAYGYYDSTDGSTVPVTGIVTELPSTASANRAAQKTKAIAGILFCIVDIVLICGITLYLYRKKHTNAE